MPRLRVSRGRFCTQRCFLRYSGETSIEQMSRQELEKCGAPFSQQVKFKRYHVDFLLPNRRAVIECDGGYWHRLFAVITRDHSKNEYLESLGYQVFRFSEGEIRANVSACVDRVLVKI
jgi:very-short-patch-repair endonuclease